MAEAQRESGGVFLNTIIFIAIIALLPIFMDFCLDLALAVGLPRALIIENPWIKDVLGYVPLYLLMLFYMKTTFNPLSYFGYNWNTKYVWWSVYIGIGSGVIMYLIDWMSGLDSLGVQPFTVGLMFGYLITWVILPALAEETLFRGVIQTVYQNKLKKTVTNYQIHIAVFIAVGFELLFHIAIPMYYGTTSGGIGLAVIKAIPQLIYVAVFGFISGVVYQRTGSLLGPFLIHGLGNGTELALIWMLH